MRENQSRHVKTTHDMQRHIATSQNIAEIHSNCEQFLSIFYNHAKYIEEVFVLLT